MISQTVNFPQTNNLENLFQLSLLSAYINQLQQAKEIERKYTELCVNYSQALYSQTNNKDSDISTNEGENDSVAFISNPQSPESVSESDNCDNFSTYIEMDSDADFEDIEEEQVVNKTNKNKSNGQFNISSDLLADIPNLEKKSQNRNARSRGLKMLWSPSEERTEDVNLLMIQLESVLDVNISNQEKICKLYKENNFSAEETLRNVMEDKARFRFELKDKRAVVSLKTKSKKH